MAAMLFAAPAVRAQTVWRTDSIEDPAWERFSVCFDNGEPPFILPLARWRGGWTPGDSAAP